MLCSYDMSSDTARQLTAVLPRPSILVDPCVLLDEMGIWATARLHGSAPREIDLYLPVRRTVRRLEIGHGEDAIGQLGRASRQRLLNALDKALTKPLRLVVDPRRSDGSSSCLLDENHRLHEPAVHALASVIGADAYDAAGYAVEFSIREPRHERLALGAASVFGPHASTLFRASAKTNAASVGPILLAPPSESVQHPALPYARRLRIARYVRSATVNALGRNTLEAQHRRINEFLRGLGACSRHSLVDEGCSGMSNGRSGLDALLRLVKSGKVDAIVATSADRLFRSATQFDRFLLQLRSHGVTLLLVEHASTLGSWENLPRRRKVA